MKKNIPIIATYYLFKKAFQNLKNWTKKFEKNSLTDDA